jgi:penicillin-binding protein 1A
VDGTYGTGQYVTVQYALQKSLNTVSAHTVNDYVKVRNSYEFLKEHFGFAKLDDVNDVVLPSMAVGSMRNGFSTLEEAAAYACLGNGGIYYSPLCYYTVVIPKENGETDILDGRKQQIKKRAFSEDTAKVMNELLQTIPLGNYVTNGNNKTISKFKTFGKTGTTSDNKDRWFAGGSPYYTASVWFGYDIPKDLGQLQNPAAKIWMEVFNRIHKGLDPAKKKFPSSNKAVQKSYCQRTGLLAGENCPSTATGWYRVSNLPKVCTTCGTYIPPETTINGGNTPAEETTRRVSFWDIWG